MQNTSRKKYRRQFFSSTVIFSEESNCQKALNRVCTLTRTKKVEIEIDDEWMEILKSDKNNFQLL